MIVRGLPGLGKPDPGILGPSVGGRPYTLLMWGLLVWTFVIVGVLAALMAVWKWLLAALVVYVAVKLTRLWWRNRQARLEREHAAEAARIAKLTAHADREHRLIQQGNVDGVYGSYPVPKDLRETGIWLADNKERPRRDDGAARDVGFAG